MPDIAIPLVGPSNEGIHPKADCQRSINLYPVKIEREGEKARWHLQGTPGLLQHINIVNTPLRGMYVYRARLFVVAGAILTEVHEDGTSTNWGAINSSRGRVSMCELGDDLVIGDGAGFYSFNLSVGLFPITDAPIGRWCVAFDQRVLYLERDSGRVFYSDLNDARTIDPLSFFTAENKPDDALALIATEDQIWIPGEDGAEVWYDSGDADNPYQRIPGGLVSSGLMAEDTLQYLDNSIWWVEKNKDGRGIVRRSVGFNAQRVSTAAVERFAESATNLSAYVYEEQGESFYVLSADEGTWAFGVRSAEWHERAFLNQSTGDLKRARPEIHAFAFGKHLVSDYENGKIYHQSLSYYDDDGTPLVARRITAHTDADGRALTVDELWVDMAVGVGLITGQGSAPVAMLRYSTNGGQTWSNELQRDIGAIGEYGARVTWNSLGVGRDWSFEISVSDPVPRVLIGARARVRVGRR